MINVPHFPFLLSQAPSLQPLLLPPPPPFVQQVVHNSRPTYISPLPPPPLLEADSALESPAYTIGAQLLPSASILRKRSGAGEHPCPPMGTLKLFSRKKEPGSRRGGEEEGGGEAINASPPRGSGGRTSEIREPNRHQIPKKNP